MTDARDRGRERPTCDYGGCAGAAARREPPWGRTRRAHRCAEPHSCGPDPAGQRELEQHRRGVG